METKSAEGRAKDFWKTLRKIAPKRKQNDVQPSMSNFLQHFKNLSKPNREPIIPQKSNFTGPLDFLITHKELENAGKNLRDGKSPGYDNITNEMIKALVEAYPELILKLFNGILKSGKSISSWEVGLIVPIHKDGSKLDPSN